MKGNNFGGSGGGGGGSGGGGSSGGSGGGRSSGPYGGRWHRLALDQVLVELLTQVGLARLQVT